MAACPAGLSGENSWCAEPSVRSAPPSTPHPFSAARQRGRATGTRFPSDFFLSFNLTLLYYYASRANVYRIQPFILIMLSKWTFSAAGMSASCGRGMALVSHLGQAVPTGAAREALSRRPRWLVQTLSASPSFCLFIFKWKNVKCAQRVARHVVHAERHPTSAATPHFSSLPLQVLLTGVLARSGLPL